MSYLENNGTLVRKNIIELKRGGRGRLPTVRIIAPKKKLN